MQGKRHGNAFLSVYHDGDHQTPCPDILLIKKETRARYYGRGLVTKHVHMEQKETQRHACTKQAEGAPDTVEPVSHSCVKAFKSLVST